MSSRNGMLAAMLADQATAEALDKFQDRRKDEPVTGTGLKDATTLLSVASAHRRDDTLMRLDRLSLMGVPAEKGAAFVMALGKVVAVIEANREALEAVIQLLPPAHQPGRKADEPLHALIRDLASIYSKHSGKMATVTTDPLSGDPGGLALSFMVAACERLPDGLGPKVNALANTIKQLRRTDK